VQLQPHLYAIEPTQRHHARTVRVVFSLSLFLVLFGRLNAVQWRNRMCETLALAGRGEEAISIQRVARGRLDGWLGRTGDRGEVVMANEGLAEALWRGGHQEESERITAGDIADLREKGPRALLAGRLRTLSALDTAQSDHHLDGAIQAVEEVILKS